MLLFTLELGLALLFSVPCHTQSPQVCNNSPALCDRAYDNVTYLGAHDSMFVRNATNNFTVSGNQFFPSPVQLDAGVRLLTGQIYQIAGSTGEDEYHLCHSLCVLYDAGTLAGWLSTIKSWLDDNLDDVVTILLVNADNISAADLAPQFEDAQISQYAYVPPNTTQATRDWPTLRELISMNKRLVIFIASLDPVTTSSAPYLLDEFTFVFENSYENTSPSAFSCTANRPSSVNGSTAKALSMNLLPLLNHFLYDVEGGFDIPAPEQVATINAISGGVGNLGDAATECTEAYGIPIVYILVDFFNAGPAIDSVDRLNGVQGNITGRRSLPLSVYSTGPGPTATVALTHTLTTNTSTSAPSYATSSATTSATGGSATTSAGSATPTTSSTASNAAAGRREDMFVIASCLAIPALLAGLLLS